MAGYSGYPVYNPDQQECYYGNGNQVQFQQYPPPSTPVIPYGIRCQNPFSPHNPPLRETVPAGPGIGDNYDNRTYEGSNITTYYPVESHLSDIPPAVEPSNFYPPRTPHDSGTAASTYSISGTPVLYSTPRFPFRGRGTFARGQKGTGYNRGGTTGRNFTSGASQKTSESAAVQSKSTQYYCDVCKVSCIGPLAFRDHQAGQRHKKRTAQCEAAEKLKSAAVASDSSNTDESSTVKATATKKRKLSKSLPGVHELRCALCDVGCTGVEAYTAHINGKLHQKTLRLHRDLGKPIPSTDNPLVPTEVADVVSRELKKTADDNEDNTTEAVTAENGNLKHVDLKCLSAAGPDKPIVGEEYIETDTVVNSKATHYRCKLCDCQFSADAKDLHLKGRRHRLQYKNKVDPSLDIQPKSSNIIHRKFLATQRQNELPSEHPPRVSDFLPPFSSPPFGHKQVNFLGVPPGGVPGARLPLAPPLMGSQPNIPHQHPSLVVENRYVMSKHASILPTEIECQAVKVVIGVCEHALKRISDNLLQKVSKEKAAATGALDNKDNEDSTADANKEKADIEKSRRSLPVTPNEALRLLRGVVRVGALGQGLLLHGEHYGDLILVCSEWPTVQLVQYLVNQLPDQMPEPERPLEFEFLSEATLGRITIVAKPKPTEGGCKEIDWPIIKVRIQLTSPAIYADHTGKSVTNSESAMEVEATSGEKEAGAQPSRQRATQSVSGKVSDAATVTGVDAPSSTTTVHPEQQTPVASVSPAGIYHHAVLGGPRGEPIARRRCLNAFEAINQAKWFQSVFNKPGLAVVSRVIRDFIMVNTLWSGLNEFALLVLLDRLQSTDNYTSLPRTRGGGPHPYAGMPGHRSTGPARLLRRFFEVVASGLLLSITQVGDDNASDLFGNSTEFKNGEHDEEPSHFYPIDLFCQVPLATREQITVEAQFILRQICFRQLYKVLRTVPLSTNYPRNSRNDSRTSENGEESGTPEADKVTDTDEDAEVPSAKQICQGV